MSYPAAWEHFLNSPETPIEKYASVRRILMNEYGLGPDEAGNILGEFIQSQGTRKGAWVLAADIKVLAERAFDKLMARPDIQKYEADYEANKNTPQRERDVAQGENHIFSAIYSLLSWWKEYAPESYKLWPWFIRELNKRKLENDELPPYFPMQHWQDVVQQGGLMLADMRRHNRVPQGFDINQMNFQQFDQWLQDKNDEKAGKEFKERNVIFELKDDEDDEKNTGWTIQIVDDPADLSLEGKIMGHCVGGYSGSSSTIYSLRDPKNLPHVTFEVNPDGEVVQLMGKGNSEPNDEYKDMINEWLDTSPENVYGSTINEWARSDPGTREEYFGDYVDERDWHTLEHGIQDVKDLQNAYQNLEGYPHAYWDYTEEQEAYDEDYGYGQWPGYTLGEPSNGMQTVYMQGLDNPGIHYVNVLSSILTALESGDHADILAKILGSVITNTQKRYEGPYNWKNMADIKAELQAGLNDAKRFADPSLHRFFPQLEDIVAQAEFQLENNEYIPDQQIGPAVHPEQQSLVGPINAPGTNYWSEPQQDPNRPWKYWWEQNTNQNEDMFKQNHPQINELRNRGAKTAASVGLDSFTRGYMEAMLWANTHSEDGEPIDARATRFHPASEPLIIDDCQQFQDQNRADLEAMYEMGAEPEDAGMDFALTRNGHGTGFWDRGLGEVGDRLAQEAKAYGETTAYLGDDAYVHLYDEPNWEDGPSDTTIPQWVQNPVLPPDVQGPNEEVDMIRGAKVAETVMEPGVIQDFDFDNWTVTDSGWRAYSVWHDSPDLEKMYQDIMMEKPDLLFSPDGLTWEQAKEWLKSKYVQWIKDKIDELAVPNENFQFDTNQFCTIFIEKLKSDYRNSKVAKDENDPEYSFMYYKSALEVVPWSHNVRYREIAQRLLNKFNTRLEDGGWKDDEGSWAGGDIYREDGGLRVEFKHLADPDIQTDALYAIKAWWKDKPREDKDIEWEMKDEEHIDDDSSD